MASMPENLLTISKAVYGKEMRPAIIDALSQSWDQVKTMISEVDALSARVDALPDVEPDNPDTPDVPVQPTGSSSIRATVIQIMNGTTTPLSAAGYADVF